MTTATLDHPETVAAGRWSNIGHHINGMSVADAIAAHLPWTVSTRSLAYLDTNGSFRPVVDHFATVRSDNGRALGIVSNRYRPIQHSEIAGDIETLCGESGARPVFIGELQGGKRVWMLLQLTQEALIAGDRFQQNIVVLTSHDGSTRYTIAPSPVRIACNNQYHHAVASARDGITLSHTLNGRAPLTEARAALGRVQVQFSAFRDTMESLAAARLSSTAASFLLEKMFPSDTTQTSKKRDSMLAMFHNPRGGLRPSVNHTALGLYNAVTEYVDYAASVRTRGRSEEAARAESSLIGTGARTRDDALTIIQAALANKELANRMAELDSTDNHGGQIVQQMLAAMTN